MWINIPAVDDRSESINFDFVKEIYVCEDTLYVVEDGADKDSINWFKQPNKKAAKSLERQLMSIIGVKVIVSNNVEDNETKYTEKTPSAAVKPTV